MTSPLVDVAWLAEHLDDPRVVVVDVRWYLGTKRGPDEYARGHVPGAVYLDLDADLARSSTSGAKGPGRHPLPRADDFARVLARIGVERETLVVAYDDAGGSIAARLWWLLRWFGHEGGRVLDGGLPAWIAAGHALTTDVPSPRAVEPLPLAARAEGVVDANDVERLRARAGAVVLDARATERFEGRVEPIDARPGHIPSALSAPFVGNLQGPGGVFLPRADLERRYADLGALTAETVVCYCGSGVTACHDILALAIAGRDDVLLYEGSWSDWAGDASRPAATGPSKVESSVR